MSVQRSATVRNAQADAVESTIGTSPHLRIRTGDPPANCAASRSGTILVNMELPSDWLGNASSGAKSKSGTWSANAIASGVAGHYEIMDASETNCHEQGTISELIEKTTNGSTASGGNALNFASTTGISVGMNVSGEWIALGATVISLTGTTVTMSHATNGIVQSSDSIQFYGDMIIQNTSINSGQTVTIPTYNFTVGNA